jgi:hypothetical protein
MRAEKPLFKPCLNKEIRPVEHLGLESRRVLGKMHQCQFGKNQPDPSTSGWKFTITWADKDDDEWCFDCDDNLIQP